jgi:NTE family protein
MDEMVGEKTFDDLLIPCAVTAVDAKSGAEITLSTGKLKDAILSTIALPGIFPTFRLNDWELMDGGVLNPVPVSVARALSPDLPVVAVVLNDPMDKPIRPYTIPVPGIFPRPIADRIARMTLAQSLDIFLRAVDISSRAVAHFRLELDHPDVIIRPKVHHIELLDKVVVPDVAELGARAVDEVLPELKRAVSWTRRLGKKWFGVGQ